MRLDHDDCFSRLRSAEHGTLCTWGAQDTIDAVPICYVVVSERIVTPIDRIKPKTTTQLGRLKNLDRNGTATLLCDEWHRSDWSQLWWVRARLTRRVGSDNLETSFETYERALREKYVQYRDTEFVELVAFDVVSLIGWAAAQPEGAPPVS
jgi:hypothetical protein